MNIVSLFSGAGGMDLGLIKAGHQIIWANDIFLDAVHTYRDNIGHHIDTRDISDIKSSEIPVSDVIVGGFPCQGFSVANWNRTVDDPRNQLYKQMVRVIKDKQPKYVICENVKGLASMDKGKVLINIVQDLKDIGYNVQHNILNSADYGVPQSRMRLIILGSRTDLPIPNNFPPTPTHFKPNLVKGTMKPWVTVGKALSHFPEPESILDKYPNHQNSKYKLRFNGHLGHRFVDPDKPSPTVTARGDERGGVVVLHHPSNKRRMTAREMAAVQSFPDKFKFYGTKTSAYRQIANAVPVLLAKAIGIMLKEAEKKENT
jgi:DNA (cytosine-5)-methyltransferase 1